MIKGRRAHAGVFKSSPSRMSDELTRTCSSQACRGNWMLDIATLFDWAGRQTGQVPHGKLSHTRTSSTRTFRGWSRAKSTHPTGARRSYREDRHTDSSQWLRHQLCEKSRCVRESEDEKSLRSSSRVVSVNSCVWGGQTPGIHTRRTQGRQ